MELKVIGTIKKVMDKQTFDSGFTKVEFVLTTDETYPQDIKFEVVKHQVDDFIKFNKPGDRLEIKFNLRGNEFKDNYYVNLQAWYTQNVESNESEGTTSRKTLVEAEGEDDLPF